MANSAVARFGPASGRVLLLLQDKGVLKLNPGVGFKPTVADIVENPRKFRIVEVDAAQTARTLDDVDVAAVNTNYATQAGLDPVKDAILREDPKGPLYQSDRGARLRQGQALGQASGRQLSLAGGQRVRSHQV